MVSVGIVGVTALLALTLYRLHPIFLARRYRTAPLEDPLAEEEVERLAAIAGVRPPALAIKPGFLDGVAFGRAGREVLALGGNRAILTHRWSPHTRAVALHEMAHLVNQDIRTRVGSSSVWIALSTVLCAVGLLVLGTSLGRLGQVRIPLFRPSFAAPEAESPFFGDAAILMQALVLLLVVRWLWAELIRARERYADARVRTWGFREPLLAVLRLRGAYGDTRRLGRRHPTRSDLAEHLENPGKLFQASLRLAFLTGLLATLIGAQMTPLATDLTFILVGICGPLIFLFGPVAILVLPVGFFAVLCSLSYLVTGALGAQIQREAVAELATQPHHCWGYLPLLRTAFSFALGVEAGLLLSPFSPFGIGKAVLWVLGWLLILTFVVWLWLVFLKGATRFLLGSSPIPSSSIQVVITGLSSVILAALLGSALAFRLTLEAGYRFDQTASLAPPGSNPVEFFAVIFVMSSLYLLAGVLGLYLALGFFTWLAATLRVFLRRGHCRRCGEPAPALLLIGRRCPSCRAPLAPWPLLGEPS